METIKNYLDNMFASLPDTPEVRRAKEELCQMMEDKYMELKKEGISENEAIGRVITEFGNLDEIKEELGLEAENYSYGEYQEEERHISLTQAKRYLSTVEKCANYIATGVMLCVFSPIMIIFFSGLSEFYGLPENLAVSGGMIFLFVLVVVAVGIFIYSDYQTKEFKYLKDEGFYLDIGVKTFVEEERNQKKNVFTMKTIMGVTLCIISVIPVIVTGVIWGDGFSVIFSVCLLLFIVGIGTFFLVSCGMAEDAYKVLLTDGGHRGHKKRIKDKRMETISSVYWCIVTVIYLAWSFLTFHWGSTWVIWPVAGVLFWAVRVIYDAVMQNNE